VFSAYLSSRAVPATPGERLGASAEHLPETCGLRAAFRHSASPTELTRLHLSSLRATARDFVAGGLPTSRHPGPASAGRLTASRRGPHYSTAQQFVEVGSFHPTRYAPLARRTKTRFRLRIDGPRLTSFCKRGELACRSACSAFSCLARRAARTVSPPSRYQGMNPCRSRHMAPLQGVTRANRGVTPRLHHPGRGARAGSAPAGRGVRATFMSMASSE
jgi:hypothetical protein